MRAIAVTSLLAGALLAVCAPPAAADPDVGAHGEAFQKGNTAGVKLTNSKIGLSGNGLGGKSDGYRMPRPCWYEPNSSADDMRSLQAQQKKQAVEAGLDYDVDLDRFGEKIGDKGQWWGAAYDAGNPDGASCAAGLEPLIWVPEGTTPAGGITLEQLMQIARAALTVPEPKIKLSPDAKSYVNLGTWVWLDGAEAAPGPSPPRCPGSCPPPSRRRRTTSRSTPAPRRTTAPRCSRTAAPPASRTSRAPTRTGRANRSAASSTGTPPSTCRARSTRSL
ncbi:hypothetical protein GCM10027612_23190 [Microbispora bryophytorum subsp. camponoti]